MKKNLFNYIMVILVALTLGGMLVACGNGTNSNTTYATTSELNSILTNYLQNYGESQYFSAMSATIQCGNNPPVNSFVGTYQLHESGGLINSNSLFQVGSISKSFTSVVILQLANDPSNNLSLQDNIGKWFRHLDGTLMYPQWESVTIKELMNMSSGIPDYMNDQPNVILDSLLNPKEYFNPLELIVTVESTSILYKHGTNWNYSNTNYILLGELIQNITGNSPITEIQNRIINKLNLTHTFFPTNLPASVVPISKMINGYAYFKAQDLPPGYESIENTLYNITWNSMSSVYTAGAIISTPSDLNTYIHALYNPNKGLLNQNEISMLNSFIGDSDKFPNIGQPITLSESTPIGYGLGVFGVYNYPNSTGATYLYNGATLGFSAFWFYNPKLDLYISYAMNAHQPNFNTLYPQLFEYAVKTQCGESIPFISPFLY